MPAGVDLNLGLVIVDMVAIVTLVIVWRSYRRTIERARTARWWWGWWVATADAENWPVQHRLERALATGPDGELVELQREMLLDDSDVVADADVDVDALTEASRDE